MRDFMLGKRWMDLSPDEKQKLRKYGLDDAVTSLEIVLKYADRWPANEALLSRMTIDMCLRGLMIDQAELQAQLATAQMVRTQAEEAIPWDRPLARRSFSAACAMAGIPEPSTTSVKEPEFRRWIEEYRDRAPWMEHISDFRRSTLLITRAEKMQNRIMSDGRMHYDLRYFGAHTGRWVGGEGINTQNFSRNAFKNIDLRTTVIASEGLDLGVCDLSQIEPTALAYISNDQPLLEKIRAGFSVYESQAIAWGWWKGEPGTFKKDERYKDLYWRVKVNNLGCGYGMGWLRMRDHIEGETGVRLSEADAKALVKAYRDNNPAVVACWKYWDQQLRIAAAGDGEFQITLPSGRVFGYSNVRWERPFPPDPENRPHMVGTAAGEHGENRLWGGIVVEGLCQTIARDIFSEGLIRLHQAVTARSYTCTMR
jgi:hypothetical protein